MRQLERKQNKYIFQFTCFLNKKLLLLQKDYLNGRKI